MAAAAAAAGVREHGSNHWGLVLQDASELAGPGVRLLQNRSWVEMGAKWLQLGGELVVSWLRYANAVSIHFQPNSKLMLLVACVLSLRRLSYVSGVIPFL